MMNTIVIDRTTYKIMKYMYGKRSVTYFKIRKKFGDDAATLVFELCRGNYAAQRLPNKQITCDTSAVYDESEFSLLVPGNKYVEDRRANNVIRITPILVSVVSVIVSVVSLIISLTSSNTELFVHLLD